MPRKRSGLSACVAVWFFCRPVLFLLCVFFVFDVAFLFVLFVLLLLHYLFFFFFPSASSSSVRFKLTRQQVGAMVNENKDKVAAAAPFDLQREHEKLQAQYATELGQWENKRIARPEPWQKKAAAAGQSAKN